MRADAADADGYLMFHPPSASRSKERGATLVEFAIVAPILVLLVVGMLELGLAMYRLQGLHAASRDAARIGSYASMTQSQVEDRALASLESTLLESPPAITVEPDTEHPCADSDQIVVTIVAETPLSIPFVDNPSLTLTSRAEFACEN